MDSMDVSLDGDLAESEIASQDKISNDGVAQTDERITEDRANALNNQGNSSSNIGVNKDLQVKLQIGDTATESKSRMGSEIRKASSAQNHGDRAAQNTSKSKMPIPTTSKIGVKRRRAQVLAIPVIRQILPRKSKEKAKQMLKIIAKGIIIPRGIVFRERIRRRTIRKATVKRAQPAQKRRSSNKTLLTVWKRPSKRRSFESLSEYRCSTCGQCSCSDLYY